MSVEREIFRQPVMDMQPYSPPLEGRSQGFSLLDFNERTTPPHALVLRDVREYATEGDFQKYPEYGDLDSVIAAYIGVKPTEVIITNGSDQGIDIIYRALVKDGDKVIVPAPTFAMLEQSAHVQGATIISPRYEGDKLDFPFQEVIDAISSDIKLIVICNPNNPTGTGVSREESEAIIKKAADANVSVLVDEAYHEFSPELTVVDLIPQYSNLFVARSFSKTMGVSSLRAGAIVSQEQNIAELRKIRGPYDVNMPAAIAMRALRYPEVVEDIKAYVEEVMGVSKPMIEDFYIENGIKFFPSSAGFHLIEAPGLYDFLRTRDGQKILIRPRSDPPGTVRVSIGTREDTEKYIEAFGEYLKVNK